MNKTEHLQFATFALQKLYPKYSDFIEALIKKMNPFLVSNQQQEKTQFIHLIAYQPKEKVKNILIDLLSLLGLQSETILLLENDDINGFTVGNQLQNMQQNYPVLPKVVVTDFFYDHFCGHSFGDYNRERRIIDEFLRDREKLDFSQFEVAPSDARKTLGLSILDLFGEWKFLKTRLVFKFFWEKKVKSIDKLKAAYIPEELEPAIDGNLLRKDELLFFSKDKPYQMKLASNLIKVHHFLEHEYSEKSDFQVLISYMAMDYFCLYVHYKKLSYAKLKQEASIFFLPVFHQIPRMLSKVNEDVETVEIDFKEGWKINVNHS